MHKGKWLLVVTETPIVRLLGTEVCSMRQYAMHSINAVMDSGVLHQTVLATSSDTAPADREIIGFVMVSVEVSIAV